MAHQYDDRRQFDEPRYFLGGDWLRSMPEDQPARLPRPAHRPIGSREAWRWDVESEPLERDMRVPFPAGDVGGPEFERFRIGEQPGFFPGMSDSRAAISLHEPRTRPSDGRLQRRRSFRGLGPRGYQRSAATLREMLCECLTEDHLLDASDITIEVTDREVTLSGTVHDRVSRFRAEELVDRCGGGVEHIDNRLRVVPRRQAGDDR